MAFPSRIALVGFPCSGKTSLGQALAQALAYAWVDTDQAIASLAQASIAEIFANEGEAGFRQREGEWLRQDLPSLRQTIISTGGGLPCFGNHWELLNAQALTIYLQADFDILYQRLLLRPEHTLLQTHTQATLAALFVSRDQIYTQADLVLTVDQPLTALLTPLIDLLKISCHSV